MLRVLEIAERLRKNLSQPAGLMMEREEEGKGEGEGEGEGEQEERESYQPEKFHSESGTVYSFLSAQVGPVLLYG